MWRILLILLLMPSIAYAQSELDQADKALDQIHSWRSLDQWRVKYSPTYDDGYLSEFIADFVEGMFANKWDSLPNLVSLSKSSPGLFKFAVGHLGDITSCAGTKTILTHVIEMCPKGYQSYCGQIKQQLYTSDTAPQCLPARLRSNNSVKRTAIPLRGPSAAYIGR